MKKSAMLAGIAAVMGASIGMTDPFATRCGIPRPEPKIANENRKKCKSCKHFNKIYTGQHYPCMKRNYGNPMYIACERYERRKKK